MQRRHTVLVGLAATAAVALVAGQASTAAADRGGTTVNHGTLMELNDSGVTGTVTVLDKGDHLRVNLNATGLEPGRLHMQHIHGFGATGDATCPDMSLDANMDGVLDIAEGLPAYGPVAVTLTDMESDLTDRLAYSRTFTHTDPTATSVPAGAPVSVMGELDRYVVVVHGLTVGGTYVAATPVACAVLDGTGQE